MSVNCLSFLLEDNGLTQEHQTISREIIFTSTINNDFRMLKGPWGLTVTGPQEFAFARSDLVS
jgi:hypothetical protein